MFSEIGQGDLYNDSEHDYFQREPYRLKDLLNESGNSSGLILLSLPFTLNQQMLYLKLIQSIR